MLYISFPDDFINATIEGVDVVFDGTGQPEDCLKLVDDYVYKAEPFRCHPKPCAIGRYRYIVSHIYFITHSMSILSLSYLEILWSGSHHHCYNKFDDWNYQMCETKVILYI